MTTQRWDDDRLDRLADSVEANTEAIKQLQSATSRLISIVQEEHKATTEVFNILIQEIRGLRTEQRRILNHLFGEQGE